MGGGRAITRPHCFTVADYHRMMEMGLFRRSSRVELIRGEIIDIADNGPLHFSTVNRLTRMLVLAVGAQGTVCVQNPVRLGVNSEPEPDIVILKPRADGASGAPGPDDVLLLIEVADASLHYDRSTKASLYAEGGIQEYWIANVWDRSVEVHRRPVDGRYDEVRQASTGGLDALLLSITVSITELLRTGPL